MTGSQSGGHAGRACAKVLWQERAGLFLKQIKLLQCGLKIDEKEKIGER